MASRRPTPAEVRTSPDDIVICPGVAPYREQADQARALWVAKVQNSTASLPVPESRMSDAGGFEQLTGASYAIQRASALGAWTRCICGYKELRAGILEPLAGGGRHPSPELPPRWLVGFYINAAFQRITFAADRALTYYAFEPCACGHTATKKDVDGMGRIVVAALAHCKHGATSHPEYTAAYDELLKQLVRDAKHARYERDDPFDMQRAYAMLRYDVNNRKHVVHGPSSQDRACRNATGQTWSTSASFIQMEAACRVFVLIVEAYVAPRHFEEPASG